MIEFIQSQTQPPSQPVFRDVKEDQFFIDGCGNLCQKSGDESYVTIADPKGKPFSTIEENVDGLEEITKVLATIDTIRFA
jgi:hypothetical protein